MDKKRGATTLQNERTRALAGRKTIERAVGQGVGRAIGPAYSGPGQWRIYRMESAEAEPRLSGRAACEWAEYASGALGEAESGTIPAFEEVKAFLPLWALPTKLTDGLVEVWTGFEV